MYSSGDAAEQVVRMSLEGAEFALKISGSAAEKSCPARPLHGLERPEKDQRQSPH